MLPRETNVCRSRLASFLFLQRTNSSPPNNLLIYYTSARARNLPILFLHLGNFTPYKSGGMFSNSQQLFVQRGKKGDLPTFELEIISEVFHERWGRERGSLRSVSPGRDCAPRCKNISNERPCLLARGFPTSRENTILSLPFLASNDPSNFKEEFRKKERYSQRSSIIQAGPRLVSKKCRPFSREERIYIYDGINLGVYISRKLWSEGLKGEICRYR